MVIATEAILYEHIAQYLNLKHPTIVYHWDLSGVYTPSHKAKNLYGRLNVRAYPDLFVALPVGQYHGLFLELKREGTVINKVNGELRTNVHLHEQAMMLQRLRERGYAASFGVGYDQTIELIEAYIAGSYTQV